MDILNHPQAQALLADAELSAVAVRSCTDRLTCFVQRYLPLFHREEQRGHALTILRGKLTGLQRKTTEPIATEAGQKRRPLQLVTVHPRRFVLKGEKSSVFRAFRRRTW